MVTFIWNMQLPSLASRSYFCQEDMVTSPKDHVVTFTRNMWLPLSGTCGYFHLEHVVTPTWNMWLLSLETCGYLYQDMQLPSPGTYGFLRQEHGITFIRNMGLPLSGTCSYLHQSHVVTFTRNKRLPLLGTRGNPLVPGRLHQQRLSLWHERRCLSQRQPEEAASPRWPSEHCKTLRPQRKRTKMEYPLKG